MKSLKPITMYECQHCKALFKTPNKHNCRRDPGKTNCYTCEHWGHEFYWSYGGDRETCDIDKACKMHETSQVDIAHGLMKENGWYLDCGNYKYKSA